MPARDERGVVLSSGLVLVSVAAVAAAAVAYAFTGTTPPRAPERSRLVAAAPMTVEPPVVLERVKPPPVRRSATYVEVYNNSGISGLAARTAEGIGAAGWQVVGEDNWYGTIPTTSVYYPPRLQREGRLLARDVGIGRVAPAIDPMRMDRLTVILTTDYAG